MPSASQPVSHLWAFVQAVPVPGMPGKSQPSEPTANMALCPGSPSGCLQGTKGLEVSGWLCVLQPGGSLGSELGWRALGGKRSPELAVHVRFGGWDGKCE